MDYGSLPDWLSFGANAIMAIAAVMALTTWRREVLGKKRIETAEDVLLQVYDLVPKIRLARQYVVLPIGPIDAEMAEVLRYRATEASDRLRDLLPEIERLDRSLHAVKARLDRDGVRAVTDLLIMIHRLRMYATNQSFTLKEGSIVTADQALIFRSHSDTVDDQLQELVVAVEKALRKHVR